VELDVLTDMHNICQGKDPRAMCILELGCGAGRVTRTLAKVFGEVHALDVSGEMVDQVREAVRDLPNAFVCWNNGVDLRVLGDRLFDFAYSGCVFHHIGERKIIENYVREVHRLLRPGCLFKFEVQGCVKMKENPEETWLGALFSEEQAVRMAVRSGFDPATAGAAGRSASGCGSSSGRRRQLLFVPQRTLTRHNAWRRHETRVVRSQISWSGRRDSNPRRPAWEIDCRLKIKNLASTESDSNS